MERRIRILYRCRYCNETFSKASLDRGSTHDNAVLDSAPGTDHHRCDNGRIGIGDKIGMRTVD